MQLKGKIQPWEQGLALSGPIYMVRLRRMRQAYDRPTKRIVSRKSNQQLAYRTVTYVTKHVEFQTLFQNTAKECPEFVENYVFCDKFLQSRREG